MHILDQIVAHKQDMVATARRRMPAAELRRTARARSAPRSLAGSLAAPGPRGVNVIAEIKRASPSKGTIRPHLDPADYAHRYEHGGAAALSVLTDRRFFNGSPGDLIQARAAVGLPVLRKDFIVSDYQVIESAAMGADAVLLIVRILEPTQLRDYIDLARQFNLDALVEVHTEAELETGITGGAELIGINNRDLDTFAIDLDTTVRLAALLGPDHIGVAESGIRHRRDVTRIRAAGIHNFLIGTGLVAAPDPTAWLNALTETAP